MNRRQLLRRLALGAVGLPLLAVFSPAPSEAGQKPVYTGFLSNLAVGGYDPVAYFTDGRPREGNSDFSETYLGVEWHFVSAENRELFKQNPERYAPQYGGYCAWAVAQGNTAKGDPRNWKIVNGKLYLNYNDEIQKRWEQDIPGMIEAGDRNWPRVLE